MARSAVRPMRPLWLVFTAGLALMLAACGTPSAPLPPSLNLPEKVSDLAATRAGSTVTLTWTMPKRTTDKLLLKEALAVALCRQEANGPCQPAGPALMMTPAAGQSYTETLPAALLAGEPRPLTYFVEVRNRADRAAGLSNPAVVLAGAVPAPVAGLKAELRKSGIVLRWQADARPETIRLLRKLLTTGPKTKPGPLAEAPEPTEQNLLVEPGPQPGRALDPQIRFGQSYEYRAQRLARIVLQGKNYELAGEISAPVPIVAADIFPPEVPANLAAVATLEPGAEPAIDLSWQPVDDASLAGYIVYRREGDLAWKRVSPSEPVTGPAFRDTPVQAGHSYSYAVSAIARNGHESQRSAETSETVPAP